MIPTTWRARSACAPSRTQIDRTWGVRDADWKRLDESDELEDQRQVWLPERFGAVTPREGARLFVMSTGVARDVASQGLHARVRHVHFGARGTRCLYERRRSASGLSGGFDGVSRGLAELGGRSGLQRRGSQAAAARAHQCTQPFLRFDLLHPRVSRVRVLAVQRFLRGDGGRLDGKNVVFDSNDAPVGVNSALLAVCRKSDLPKRKIACDQGPALLQGTGFDRRGVHMRCHCEQREGGRRVHRLVAHHHSRGARRLDHPAFQTLGQRDPTLDSTVGIDNLHFETADVGAPSTSPITAAQ